MTRGLAQLMHETCLAVAQAVPEFPTQMGLFSVGAEPVPQHYFTPIDEASAAHRGAVLDDIARALDRIDPQSLQPEERISFEFLSWFADHVYERGLIGRAGREFSGHENPLRPAVGLQCELPLFLTDLHPMRHEQDAEDFLSRLKSIPGMLRLAGDQYVERLGGKLCPPIIVQDAAIEETGNFASQPLAANPVLTAYRAKSEAIPGLTPGSNEALLADVRATLHEDVLPAYRALADRMTTARNASVAEAGLWRVPGGPEWYAFLLRAATTTTLDADTIHELGLEETARLEQRMVDAARSMGADARSIADCHGMLDAEAPGPLPDTDENRATLMADMNRRIEAMRRACEELFHRLPSGPLGVKAMPRFAENHRNQSYQPPSLDGTRPGFMELSLGQLLRDPPFETPILVYHEIYPGHHLQIAHAGELEHLPDLRRITTFDAYIEGWAKYAETIPWAHGIDTDPLMNLARMRRELISTVNLALDTGIHHKRWTFDEAAAFCVEHTGMSETFARFIVRRSVSVPAQMCAYKIGMMKMLSLRERWLERHGAGADIRDFHAAVLDQGALPLELLERVVLES